MTLDNLTNNASGGVKPLSEDVVQIFVLLIRLDEF